VWLAATFLTKPTDEEHLKNFYRRVHPGGAFWKPIAEKLPEVKGDSGFFFLFLDWIAGIILIYFALFGTGKIIFKEYGMGLLFFAVAFIAAGFIYWDLSRRRWQKVSE
jgi:SSS family solute:Na+ symporter